MRGGFSGPETLMSWALMSFEPTKSKATGMLHFRWGKDQILSVTEQSVKILRQVFMDILKDTDSIKRARTSLE